MSIYVNNVDNQSGGDLFGLVWQNAINQDWKLYQTINFFIFLYKNIRLG